MTIEIGVIIALATVLLSLLTYLNKYNTTIRNSSESDGQLKAELGYIRQGVDNIRIDLKANEKNINSVAERVTRVEESAKQAHKRLDNLKEEN